MFGGRGASSGGGGTNQYSTMKGVGYEGNPVPEDEYEANRLQNLVELRERWGRKIGSNDPKDHLMGVYTIQEVKNGKVNKETFIGTQMQLRDELNLREERNGATIRHSASNYSVTAWEDPVAYDKAGFDRKALDKSLDGPEARKAWKKAKIPY